MAAHPPAEAKIERIIVEKDSGMKLVGLLHETTAAAGSPGPGGIIVLCHGFRSSKAGKTIVEITAALVANNHSVFRFDFSGNGESDGDFDYSNYWGEDAKYPPFLAIAKVKKIILWWPSACAGANVVLLYASKYHDVPAVVNVSARFNLEKGMEERFGLKFMETLVRDGFIDVKKKKNGKVDYRITLKSVFDRVEINMGALCSHIDQECRVLTVHGSGDEITPLGDAFLFHRTVPNHVTHVIDGANHCFTSHRDELNSAILSFLGDG